jgi:hypothetical protein
MDERKTQNEEACSLGLCASFASLAVFLSCVLGTHSNRRWASPLGNEADKTHTRKCGLLMLLPSDGFCISLDADQFTKIGSGQNE